MRADGCWPRYVVKFYWYRWSGLGTAFAHFWQAALYIRVQWYRLWLSFMQTLFLGRQFWGLQNEPILDSKKSNLLSTNFPDNRGGRICELGYQRCFGRRSHHSHIVAHRCTHPGTHHFIPSATHCSTHLDTHLATHPGTDHQSFPVSVGNSVINV